MCQNQHIDLQSMHGISYDHFRKYLIKSVKSISFKDFRFQDLKDFTKDFSTEQYFKLVVDPSPVPNGGIN